MILIIAALILASGFFSLFKQALKKARKPRLHKEADSAEKQGARRKAKKYHRVITAVENPDLYFMSANFWIISTRTFATVLAGWSAMYFSIQNFAGSHYSFFNLTDSNSISVFLPLTVCAVIVICAVLLVGNFLPRRIARHAPEHTALAFFPLIEIFVLPLRPFYALMRNIGKRLQQIFPPRAEHHNMTEDELRHALMEGEKSGIVESKERTMVEGVFYLGDRPLSAFMTHRSDIQWLDINTPADEIRAKVLERREQRCFPVASGTLDSIMGAAYLEDIIIDLGSGAPADLRTIMKKALFAPETMPALKAFESFRKGKADYLFVMDEYGGFAGMISLHSLMEEIVGELTTPANQTEETVQREDGTLLTDGSLNIDDAAELLSLPELSAAHSDYHTLAGFVLSLAGELPHTGDHFTYQGYRFTVLDMDGNRIDKIEIKKDIQA